MKEYTPKHFYTIFDPFLKAELFTKENEKNTQGHEFQRQLKEKYQNMKDGDNCLQYMYWGKISVSQKASKLGTELNELVEKNRKHNFTTHLFISDFNHLWVAKVEEVCFGDDEEFYANALDFYREFQGKGQIEAWFKISDIDLIGNNAEETHQYISSLETIINSNKVYITPYVSNLRYPVIVKDFACVEPVHFDTSRPLVLENLIENESFYEKIKMIITKYSIPKEEFEKLKPTVQKEIIRTEMDFFDQKAKNWNSLYFSYFKALEWQLNHVVLNFLKSEYKDGEIQVLRKNNNCATFYFPDNPNNQPGDECIPLNEYHGNFSIKVIMNCLFSGSNKVVSKKGNRQVFSALPGLYQYVSEDLKSFLNLNKIVDTRNIIVHNDSLEVTEADFKKIRNELLGIAKTGILVELANYTTKEQNKARLKVAA